MVSERCAICARALWMSRLPPEIAFTKTADPMDRVGEFYFLDCVPWDVTLALQQRLVYEVSGEVQPKMTVLFCEHPDIVTVGRSGSRAHIRYSDEELRREGLQVRWVGRGGGCVLHAPGQLCVYPILSLARCSWSVGEYMQRFHSGLCGGLEELGIHAQVREGQSGVWGRSGLLAAFGAAVRNWVTSHGAFINVNPAMSRFARVDTVAPEDTPVGQKATMSCLLAERRLAVRMASVRAALVAKLAASFACTRYHIYTGHPLLRKSLGSFRERIARAC